jgi:hypothetical protein
MPVIAKRRRVGGSCSVAVCLFIASSCWSEPITNAALEGRWTVTDDSRKVLPPAVREARATFVLHADGTFEATEIPGELLSEAQPWRDSAISATGRWGVVTQNGDRRVQLEFLKVDDPEWHRLPHGAQLFPETTRGRNRLLHYRGDPDDRVTIVFERAR